MLRFATDDTENRRLWGELPAVADYQTIGELKPAFKTTLGNTAMIITGALVGSSGAILSYIMCKAMNRSFISVILGGFGGPAGEQMAVEGEQVAIDADGVATALNEADSVVIIPGYGMAVAQAQQSVSELTRKLRAKGKEVRFAIHPIQGDTETVVESEAQVKDQRVVRDSGGHEEMRYVIETSITIGGDTIQAEVTLTDRDSMLFRVLLGRTALRANYVIHPGKSYIQSKLQHHREA